MATTAQKVWRISQAIGDIAFSFPYSFILLEIQVTLQARASSELSKKISFLVARTPQKDAYFDMLYTL